MEVRVRSVAVVWIGLLGCKLQIFLEAIVLWMHTNLFQVQYGIREPQCSGEFNYWRANGNIDLFKRFSFS